MSAGPYRESPAERIREDKDVESFVPSWASLLLAPANLGYFIAAPVGAFYFSLFVLCAVEPVRPGSLEFAIEHWRRWLPLLIVIPSVVAIVRAAWLERARVRREIEALCAAHVAKAERALWGE